MAVGRNHAGRTEYDALVTDAGDRGPLAGLRGLGRAGFSTIAVSDAGGAGLRSRYAAAAAIAPGPVESPRDFAEALAGIVRELRPRVIYPGREEAIDAILTSPESDLLAPLLPYPRLDALDLLRDKRALPELAEQHGLHTPRTLAEGTASEIDDQIGDRPVAIKSALPGGELGATHVAHDAAERSELLSDLPAVEPIVAQEVCAGELLGLALVVDQDGGLVARFQQRASRTWPLEAGASTNAESVKPNASLVEKARRLLADVGFVGLAHLQFLSTDDRCVLIDVNPRFYGSMPLALKSGVNLAAAWHGVITGRAVPALGDYRLGVRFRWLEGNLLAASRGDLGALVDGGLGTRAGAVWSADDPVASAAWSAGAVGVRVRRRLSGVLPGREPRNPALRSARGEGDLARRGVGALQPDP